MVEKIRRVDVAHLVNDWKAGSFNPAFTGKNVYDGTVRVSNNGDDLAPGDAVKITGLGLYQLDAEEAYNDFLTSGVLLAGEKTTSNSDGENYVIAVAAEGIPAGDIGRCYLPGAFGALLGTDDPDTDKYSFVKPSADGLIMAEDGPFEYVAGTGNFAVLIPHCMHDEMGRVYAEILDDPPPECIGPNRWSYSFQEVYLDEEGNWCQNEDGLSGTAINTLESPNDGEEIEGNGIWVNRLQNQQNSYESEDDNTLLPIGHCVVQLHGEPLDDDNWLYFFSAVNEPKVFTFWGKITNSSQDGSTKNCWKYQFVEVIRDGDNWVEKELTGTAYNGMEGGIRSGNDNENGENKNDEENGEYQPIPKGSIVRITYIPGCPQGSDYWFSNSNIKKYEKLQVGDAGCQNGSLSEDGASFAGGVDKLVFGPASVTTIKTGDDDEKIGIVEFTKMGVVTVESSSGSQSTKATDVYKIKTTEEFLEFEVTESQDQDNCITGNEAELKWNGLYVSVSGTSAWKNQNSLVKYLYFNEEDFEVEHSDGSATVTALHQRGDAIKKPWLAKEVVQDIVTTKVDDSTDKDKSEVTQSSANQVVTDLGTADKYSFVWKVTAEKTGIGLVSSNSGAGGGVAVLSDVSIKDAKFSLVKGGEDFVSDVTYSDPDFQLTSTDGYSPSDPRSGSGVSYISDVQFTPAEYNLSKSSTAGSGIETLDDVSVKTQPEFSATVGGVASGEVVTGVTYNAPEYQLFSDTTAANGASITYLQSVSFTPPTFTPSVSQTQTEGSIPIPSSGELTDLDIELDSENSASSGGVEYLESVTYTAPSVSPELLNSADSAKKTVEIAVDAAFTDGTYKASASNSASSGGVEYLESVTYVAPSIEPELLNSANTGKKTVELVTDVSDNFDIGTVQSGGVQVLSGVTYNSPTASSSTEVLTGVEVAITGGNSVVTGVTYTPPTITSDMEVVTNVQCVDGEIVVTKQQVTFTLSGGGVTTTTGSIGATVTPTKGTVQIALSGGSVSETKTTIGLTGDLNVTKKHYTPGFNAGSLTPVSKYMGIELNEPAVLGVTKKHYTPGFDQGSLTQNEKWMLCTNSGNGQVEWNYNYLSLGFNAGSLQQHDRLLGLREVSEGSVTAAKGAVAVTRTKNLELEKTNRYFNLEKTSDEEFVPSYKSMGLEKTSEGKVETSKSGYSLNKDSSAKLDLKEQFLTIDESADGVEVATDVNCLFKEAVTDYNNVEKGTIVRERVHINALKANCARIKEGDVGYDEVGQPEDDNQ